MVHVPYKGGGPAMAEMLGGRVDMYPAVPSTSKSHIDAGKIFALGTTGAKRTAIMPNVPTVAEQGYPGFEATNWYAFVISSKTPKEIQQYWTRELVKALKDPEVIAALEKQGLEPEPGTPEELAKLIDTETEKWSKVVRDAKITAE
jgi:tripartite-type tricarboxylate transporter receptor subunit TctC